MTDVKLTNAEILLLEQLWKLGEASPEDVQNALSAGGKDVTGGTVRKMLLGLYKKGHVTRTKESHRYIYTAKEKPSATRSKLLGDLMLRAFDDSASLVVAALFKDNKVDEDDFKEIEQLIASYKKENKK